MYYFNETNCIIKRKRTNPMKSIISLSLLFLAFFAMAEKIEINADTQPANYSKTLVPAAPLKLRVKPCEQTDDFYSQGKFNLLFWKSANQEDVSFTITHGIIPSYRASMPKAKVEMFAEADTSGSAIDTKEIPIDGNKAVYKMKFS